MLQCMPTWSFTSSRSMRWIKYPTLVSPWKAGMDLPFFCGVSSSGCWRLPVEEWRQVPRKLPVGYSRSRKRWWYWKEDYLFISVSVKIGCWYGGLVSHRRVTPTSKLCSRQDFPAYYVSAGNHFRLSPIPNGLMPGRVTITRPVIQRCCSARPGKLIILVRLLHVLFSWRIGMCVTAIKVKSKRK